MRKSWRFTCASSCSSTSRLRSAVQLSASAGSRIAGRRMPHVIGIAGPVACSNRMWRVRPNSSDSSSTRTSHASSSTGRVTRSSHMIRAIPTASRISTAPTPLSHTGTTSVVQSGVRRQRTGSVSPAADVGGMVACAVGTTGGAGFGSCSDACGASCSASNATGTSRRGQAARRQLGNNADARGSASTPPHASVHTRWRRDAGERRRNTVTTAASTRSTVALTKASARIAIMSAALLPRVSDELAQASQLRVGEACGREIEQRRDGLLR